jgi:hypothetical protein
MPAPPMRIELTKLTEQRHRFVVVRANGVRDEADLETRSFLLHDLVHYAVEAEADIDRGFWGSLAHGTPLAVLSDRDAPYDANTELGLAESLVGPMQSCWNGRLARADYVAVVGQMAPHIVDDAFVTRVFERLRRVTGHWKATPFHRPMTLTWPPANDV